MALTTACPACHLEFAVDVSQLSGGLICPHCGANDGATTAAVPPNTKATVSRPHSVGPTAAQRRARRTKWILLLNTTVGTALFVAAYGVWRARHAASVEPVRLVAAATSTTATKPAGPATPVLTVAVPSDRSPATGRPTTGPALAAVQGPPVVAPPAQASPPAPATRPAGPPDPRPPVPDAAAIAGAERLIAEVFAPQRADTSPAGRRRLAEALARQSEDAASPAEAYALLTDARRAAIDGGDPVQAVSIATRLGRAFAIDGAEARLQTLAAFGTPADAGSAAGLVQAGADVADIAIASDDCPAAERALAAVASARRVAGASPAEDRLRADEAVLAEYRRTVPARDRLASHPDDPGANGTVAAFDLFVRHDWRRGLPLAALGSDPTLTAAARLELAGPGPSGADAGRLVAVGDAWWAAAASPRPPADAAELRDHAAAWYRSAEPSLRGLERLHVARRLDELPAVAEKPADPPSVGAAPPMAVVPSPRRIVFLCDASGSMAGVLDSVKAEVERRLGELTYDLPARQRFNVVFFNERVTPLTRSVTMRPATDSLKASAAAFIDGQVAAGSADAVLAVKAAMVYRPDLLVVLTDGFSERGQLPDVLAQLHESNRAGLTRVDCVYVPSHADPDALAGLAAVCRENGGQVTTLRPPAGSPFTPAGVAPVSPPLNPGPAAAAGPPPHHVLYLCQGSGAMVSVFGQLRRQLQLSIGGLQSTGPDQQTFNVAFFQDDRIIAAFPRGPVPASLENQRLALRFADQAIAVGGASPGAAIRYIAAEHADVVYLYSEGFSSLTGARLGIERAFARAAAPGRIDCTYLQSSEDPLALQTLTEIARLTGGTLRVVLKRDM